MIKKLEEFITNWLRSFDFISGETNYFADWIMFACGVAVVYLLFYGMRWLLTFVAKKITSRTGSLFSKALIEKRFYHRLTYIPTLILINVLVTVLFESYSKTSGALLSLLSVCSVIVTCAIIFAFLNALDDSYTKTKYAKQGSIKGIVQSIKTVIYIIASIFIICLLLNVSIGKLLATLAGASAIMMLVFKDSILGLVAGIQLSLNKMVLPGDWIEMPSADADGNVIEISQITVKVQNWDNTITTIPAYDLISKPVKNWRGMSDAGVRRIKRSIYIDMTSVQFCTKEMLDKFRKIQYLDEYISRKEKEIAEYNANVPSSDDIEMNGRHLTNLGIFRAYLQRYLEHNPMLSHDFTLMARQLQPTNLGIPIEIYVFAKTTAWTEYEKVQSDIFDYVISSIPYFDLRVYQTPSWNDYRKR